MWKALIAFAGVLGACATPGLCAQKKLFGTMPDGQRVYIYTLTNGHGLEVRISEFGAAIVSLRVPDRNGKSDDIVEGFDTFDEYLKHPRAGAVVVGRHGGRLSNGRITLDGVGYQLSQNEGPDNVHGGAHGFDTKLWRSRDLSSGKSQRVELTYISPDGEEGFPGMLRTTVIYSLNAHNELSMEFAAVSDRKTVVNLMNHGYFNLAGDGQGDVLGHVLTIVADKYSPLDARRATTGELRDVAGTPFDFRKPTAIGARIDEDDEQLRIGRGYDHHFALRDGGGARPALAARVYEPTSGRVMEVLTTETSVLLYSGQKLNGMIGKGGRSYGRSSAFALELQHIPDAPSKPWLPSTVLPAGVRYHQLTIFRFSTAP
ncbi:MAG TPA: aldose epimerase family protein [Sphingomonas sp.]|nr:aldose epimerase family protein [Sphingomonas sp.]